MTRALSSAVAFAIVAVGLTAQSHPDLAGNWVLDKAKTATLTDARTKAPAGAPGGGAVLAGGAMMSAGAPVVPEYAITVTAAAITIERLGVPTPQKYIYKLDGSESVNTVGPVTTRTKSRWAGDSLVTEGTRAISTSQGPVPTTIKEVRSLDKDGAMVVEQTRQVEGQATSTTYQVFVKKPKT